MFVQKSYEVYRGFVQLLLVTYVPLPPPPPKLPGVATPAQPAPTEGQPNADGKEATEPAKGAEGTVEVVEEPPPEFEVKMIKLGELLITFTKVVRPNLLFELGQYCRRYWSVSATTPHMFIEVR